MQCRYTIQMSRVNEEIWLAGDLQHDKHDGIDGGEEAGQTTGLKCCYIAHVGQR